MLKIFEHGVLTCSLFAAFAAGAGTVICHKQNTVSGSIGDFVLHGVKFIELLPGKAGKFFVFGQKIISLY